MVCTIDKLELTSYFYYVKKSFVKKAKSQPKQVI